MKQIGLRSYQDIITPEEQEERDRKRYEREIYEQEKAEYLADERREKECWKIVKSFWKKQGVLKMTDEEMAEEWAGWYWGASLSVKNALEEAFLAGLKAGRPKWHKVADGDLPKAENYFWSRTVLLQTNKGSSIIGFYDHANKAWYEKATDDIVYGAVEWCEIPKYTKESK